MEYLHVLKCLVAYNPVKKKFFGLDEDSSSTSVREVDNPYFAEHIVPYDKSEFDVPKVPTYYFENSNRMRGWLEGYIMVELELKIVSSITIK